jgi:hypothetical protein
LKAQAEQYFDEQDKTGGAQSEQPSAAKSAMKTAGKAILGMGAGVAAGYLINKMAPRPRNPMQALMMGQGGGMGGMGMGGMGMPMGMGGYPMGMGGYPMGGMGMPMGMGGMGGMGYPMGGMGMPMGGMGMPMMNPYGY